MTAKAPDVSVIDYGVGNLNSVINMFRRAGIDALLVRTPEEVQLARRLVLPGVGAFDTCRKALASVDGLESAIFDAIEGEIPLLGICVGMQLLATRSEEGQMLGLNVIPGQVRRFTFEGRLNACELSVPHMGWCPVVASGEASLFSGALREVNRFYFVHSYYYDCENSDYTAGMSTYGHPFTSAVERNRVFGVQFHPEKSHRYGMTLLRNFAELAG